MGCCCIRSSESDSESKKRGNQARDFPIVDKDSKIEDRDSKNEDHDSKIEDPETKIVRKRAHAQELQDHPDRIENIAKPLYEKYDSEKTGVKTEKFEELMKEFCETAECDKPHPIQISGYQEYYGKADITLENFLTICKSYISTLTHIPQAE